MKGIHVLLRIEPWPIIEELHPKILADAVRWYLVSTTSKLWHV